MGCSNKQSSKYFLILAILAMLSSACYTAPAPESYVMNGYEKIPIDRVVVIPATGISPESAQHLSSEVVQLLEMKNAFDVTLYTPGGNPEIDEAIGIAQKNNLRISNELIRKIGRLFPDHDAVLSTYQFTGNEGLEFRSYTVTPLTPRLNNTGEPMGSTSIDMVDILRPEDGYIHLRLDTLSGSQLWKLRIEMKDWDNNKKILKRIPSDLN